MKAVVATCFESNEERASFIIDVLKKKDFDVKAFTSDFSHIRKSKRDQIPNGFTALETKSYDKNLSIRRMYSHYRFAKELFNKIDIEDPDLLWLLVPANSMIKEARRFKNKHPEKKVIIDIIDMWPESLPININKNVFPLNVWKNLRNDNVACADALVCECDLYKDTLKKVYGKNITTIHWARDSRTITVKSAYPDDKLVLCYIGSINHIIDTDRIAAIIRDIDMPVLVHVIGEGESADAFLEALGKVGEVVYHGPVRDEKKKAEIFDECHAGINIYKEGLYIGLTVKCIDYFQHGLPIVNNIKVDTWNFVEHYDAGINIAEGTVIDPLRLMKMRKNNQRIYDLYNENLTKEVFDEKCRKVIDEVMG